QRLSRVRGSGRQYRTAGEERGAADPGSPHRCAVFGRAADEGCRPRRGAAVLSILGDRIRGIVNSQLTKANLQSEGTGNPQSAIRTPQCLELSALGGEWRDDCFLVERHWKLSARHGRASIGSLAATIDAA